jgi:hypothetical protein
VKYDFQTNNCNGYNWNRKGICANVTMLTDGETHDFKSEGKKSQHWEDILTFKADDTMVHIEEKGRTIQINV